MLQSGYKTIQQMYEENQRVGDPDGFLAQLQTCRIFSRADQSTDEAGWLAARSKGIGGSDVGTICAVNKYSTPRLLYFKKTGQYEESETLGFSEASKERMHFGHMLEPVVADEFIRRNNKRVVICPATLQHNEYTWALANVDRFIMNEDGSIAGILEIKTADARLLKDWEDGEPPMSYLYQLQWYLFITGLEYGVFAALIGGNRYVEIEVFRNDPLIYDVMLPAADKFWNHHVANLIVPEVTGDAADGEMNKELYADVEKGSEALLEGDEYEELAQFVLDGKEQIKQIKKQVDAATHKLQAAIGTKERGVTNAHIISWTQVTQRRVDSDRLKSDYPEVYASCIKPSTYRKFTVKGVL